LSRLGQEEPGAGYLRSQFGVRSPRSGVLPDAIDHRQQRTDVADVPMWVVRRSLKKSRDFGIENGAGIRGLQSLVGAVNFVGFLFSGTV